MKKITVGILSWVLFTHLWMPSPLYAVGTKEAAASLILPTTGQAMNGEVSTKKTKIMAGLEFGLITGTALIGGLVGGPAVWFTAGPLIANHVWSSADAYKGAKTKQREVMMTSVQDAQRNLDLSREKRYEREQQYRSDIYERVRAAGEVQG